MGKFNSVFNKGNVVGHNKIAIQKYLNQDAPKGYKYKEISPNMFALTPKDNENEVSFTVRIKFPFEFEGLHVTSIDELLDAMHRTQTPYKVDSQLQMKEPPLIKLLNSEIRNQFLMPTKFQKAGSVEVEWGDQKRELKLKRVPYASYEESKFELANPEILNIVLLINEVKSSLKIKASLDFNKLKSLNDYFEHQGLIEAFYKRKLKILGKETGTISEEYTVFEKNNRFYEVLKLLQEKFNLEFKFPHEIKNSEFFNIKILYESLINNRPVRMESDKTYRFKFDKEKTNVKKTKYLVGKDQSIFADISLELTLLHKKIRVIKYVLYTHLIMKEVIIETNEAVFESGDSNEVYYFYDMVDEPVFDGNKMGMMKKDAIEYKEIDFND